jgi:deazaflavin-dependent oxidoreductase (nitroreductase family)
MNRNWLTVEAPLPYNISDLTLMDRLDTEQFGYLTTKGRKTGSPHTIEIWFAMSPDDRKLYMLSGGRDNADWVRNIRSHPQVTIRVGNRTIEGSGRVIEDREEEVVARKLVVTKYYGREYNPSGGWEAESLPVAIDLTG